MAPGASAVVTVTIELLSSVPYGTVLNTVDVASSTPDPDLSNNSSAASTAIAGPDLANTGAGVAGLLAQVTCLMAVGLGLVVLSRRRRRSVAA
jgi:hypothetical protein